MSELKKVENMRFGDNIENEIEDVAEKWGYALIVMSPESSGSRVDAGSDNFLQLHLGDRSFMLTKNGGIYSVIVERTETGDTIWNGDDAYYRATKTLYTHVQKIGQSENLKNASGTVENIACEIVSLICQ